MIMRLQAHELLHEINTCYEVRHIHRALNKLEATVKAHPDLTLRAFLLMVQHTAHFEEFKDLEKV